KRGPKKSLKLSALALLLKHKQSAKRIAEDDFINCCGSVAIGGEGGAAKRLPLSAEKLNWNRLNRAIYAAGFAPALYLGSSRCARSLPSLLCRPCRSSHSLHSLTLRRGKPRLDRHLLARAKMRAICGEGALRSLRRGVQELPGHLRFA